MLRSVDEEPAVARDGSIAFVSNRDGTSEIHIAESNGAVIRRLTQGGGKDTPAWSPDGKQIAYVWENDGNADIYVIAREGGASVRLTSSLHDEIHPFWSPDGTHLVFTRLSFEDTPQQRLEIFIIDADGHNERQLTTGSLSSYGSLSPDGASLLFWRDSGNSANIAIADADGRNERTLTSDAAFEGWPAWSPDGKKVVFVRERGDDADLFVIELANGNLRQLTFGPGRKTSPKWSPAGQHIYFQGSVAGERGLWRIAAGD